MNYNSDIAGRPFDLEDIKCDLYRDGMTGRPLSMSTVLGTHNTLPDEDEEDMGASEAALWQDKPSRRNRRRGKGKGGAR